MRRTRFLSDPKRLAILNATLIALAILGNTYFQVFCIPTTWAIVLLTICFTNTVFFPLTSKLNKLLPLLSFINGVSFCIFIYCILFLEVMNFMGVIAIMFFGIGLLTYIPHFFAIQLIWKHIIKPVSRKVRVFFISGVVVSMIIVFFIGQEYKKAISATEDFEKSNYETLDENFMTEKILGMHFIYHTRFCEYDGWRPPKHEPVLVLGMWLNKRKDPLNVDLNQRIHLYKKFFPGNQVKFDCSCAISYNDNYHNDKRWKQSPAPNKRN